MLPSPVSGVCKESKDIFEILIFFSELNYLI